MAPGQPVAKGGEPVEGYRRFRPGFYIVGTKKPGGEADPQPG